MSNLEQISETIRQQLKDIEKKIEGLSKMKGDERFENANKIQKQLNRTKNLIQTYDFSIKDSLDDDLGVHESQYKQYEVKFSQLQKQLEYSRNEKTQQQDLFKHRGQKMQAEGQKNQRAVMIQKGHDIQEDGMNRLKGVVQNVYKMDEMADNINIELDRQINQLDSIYDNMKDTETTLKRAQKHLRYFARQIYTDRLMICLIVVIIIAIIVIIVLAAIGKTPAVSFDTIK